MLTWFSLPTTWTALVTSTQFVVVRSGFCCRVKPAELVDQASAAVFVSVRKMRKSGALIIGTAALNAANCMIHALEFKVAVAL